MVFYIRILVMVIWENPVILFESPTDAVEDEVAPEETEDDGAGEQEVEKSYFHFPNPEGEAEAEGPRRSKVRKVNV